MQKQKAGEKQLADTLFNVKQRAQEMYESGKLLIDISHELSVAEGTMRVWKSRGAWKCNVTKEVKVKEKVIKEKKRNVTKVVKPKEIKKKVLDDGTRATIINEDLTHEQRLFCIYYSKTFNAAQSYQKAYQCSYENACSHAYLLWRNAEVKKEVERLNELKRQNIVSSESDIVDLHMRIAFADIGNYLEFGRIKLKDVDGETYEANRVILNESSNVDTQLIQEIKQGRDGTSIKLSDKNKSIDWLTKYFLMNPMDMHKIDFDNKKLELEGKKLEPVNALTTGNKYNGIPATLIAKSFIDIARDIEDELYNEYVFYGGRGSTKSSFISLQITDLIEKNPDMHAAVFRQVGNTLRDSVYAQVCWAIQALGLENEYKCNVSPMEITKIATGQKIFFRGNDDPMKSKGIKAPFGYIGILWLEELDQFRGEEAVRTVTQSVIRGGDRSFIFKSFNPPKSAMNWANKYIKIPKPKMLVTHSTYLDVPKKWLGTSFLDDAEHLKEVNPIAYENEYMGVANGTGGNVFDNLAYRAITDEEIEKFDHIMNGTDWGFYPDLYAFSRVNYEPAQRRLYIWQEYTSNKQSNTQTADKLIEMGITPNDLVTCDSSEPKSVADYRAYGLLARGAEKGPGSREYSYKWLQSLNEIIIDNSRCPEAAKEFMEYEFERDKEGNVISGYPDGNDHVIDSVRYGTESVWKRKGQ